MNMEVEKEIYLISEFAVTYVKYGNLWKVLQSFPLPPEVLHAAHDDDVLELVVVEVGSSERHDEVAQPDERRVRVGEQTDHHVSVQHSHRRLVPVLRGGVGIEINFDLVQIDTRLPIEH